VIWKLSIAKMLLYVPAANPVSGLLVPLLAEAAGKLTVAVPVAAQGAAIPRDIRDFMGFRFCPGRARCCLDTPQIDKTKAQIGY
jgi:hypothetical protein